MVEKIVLNCERCGNLNFNIVLTFPDFGLIRRIVCAKCETALKFDISPSLKSDTIKSQTIILNDKGAL
jgi:protein-arginine kinase activator protein McsA